MDREGQWMDKGTSREGMKEGRISMRAGKEGRRKEEWTDKGTSTEGMKEERMDG